MKDARPFLKWAGGKTQLLPQLFERAPEEYGTYFEPFLGAGAMFFAMQSQDAVLNDSNKRLADTYVGMRDYVSNVIGLLRDNSAKHCEDFYYEQRTRQVDHLGFAGIAAWMIYMNKTCFNGIYRVNKNGGFNVPYGHREAFIPDEDNLRACSKALKGLTIESQDFRTFFDRNRPERGDFVYFDPPYAPLSATANFTAYTKGGFSSVDQRDLRDLALSLKVSGVNILLSNSSAPLIRDLYRDGFDVREVNARRNVNSNGASRGAIKELLIS